RTAQQVSGVEVKRTLAGGEVAQDAVRFAQDVSCIDYHRHFAGRVELQKVRCIGGAIASAIVLTFKRNAELFAQPQDFAYVERICAPQNLKATALHPVPP